jgi:hypothetical protein
MFDRELDPEASSHAGNQLDSIVVSNDPLDEGEIGQGCPRYSDVDCHRMVEARKRMCRFGIGGGGGIERHLAICPRTGLSDAAAGPYH